jgi:hypothetical protein
MTNSSEKTLSHLFEVRSYVSLWDSTSLKFASFKRLVKFTGTAGHNHIFACPAVLGVLGLSKSTSICLHLFASTFIESIIYIGRMQMMNQIGDNEERNPFYARQAAKREMSPGRQNMQHGRVQITIN